MKLIRCHIENFGTLSDFDFSFQDGLTIIQEVNGFGKSTFAAFIKAMFYGLPARGARNNIENERKRYQPWQGGVYGGYLVFEYSGNEYRITRTFGETAKKDKFQLYDITAHRESHRFSEKAGEEIFQLDAEAFTRSTYFTQTSANEVTATTSIRTKLSNLVDNTDDLNNYDTALEKLKEKRRGFQAYKGTGGTISELEKRCLELEQKIDSAERKGDQLSAVMEEIERLNGELSHKKAAVDDLRDKFRRSSARQSNLAQKALFDELQGDVNKAKIYLSEMDNQYPKGYPTQDEIREQRSNLQISVQEYQNVQESALTEEECLILEDGKSLYENPEQVEKEISQCSRDCTSLAGITAKLTAQMLPAELDQLAELEKRFKGGVPSENQLEECSALSDAIAENTLRLSQAVLPAEDAEALAHLELIFHDGVPDEVSLEDCEGKLQRVKQLQTERQLCRLSEAEEAEYQRLSRTFASGVPSHEQVENQQKNCRRITELTSKKNTKTTVVQESATDRKASKSPVLCGILGGLLIIGGIVCVALEQLLPGVILLAAGFLSVIAAFWMHTHQIVAGQNKTVSTITASAISEEENQELYDLQHTVNDYLLTYYSDAVDPENKLIQLMISINRFNELKGERAACEEKRQRCDAEIAQAENSCKDFFHRFYPDAIYTDSFLPTLRQDCADYVRIRNQKEKAEEKKNRLEEQIKADSIELYRQIAVYSSEAVQQDHKKALQALKDAVTRYLSLKEKQEQMRRENAGAQEQVNELTGKIQRTLLHYCVYQPQKPLGACVEELRTRLSAYKAVEQKAVRHRDAEEKYRRAKESLEAFLTGYDLSGATEDELIEWADDDTKSRAEKQSELAQAEEKLKKFLEENPSIETLEIPEEDLPDPDTLQKAEAVLQEEIKSAEEKRNERRHSRDILLREMEQIPAWTDEKERLNEQKQEDERKCQLVDAAIEYLEKARSSLAESYVGKVEAGFSKYASTLLQDELGHVFVDRDLKLFIDEKGASREVGCFSAGMIDSIMLCMRLSLIDALFTEEKPFLILDDPFINLDDDHTKRALKMLDKIAESHQIVYLVCNSSRVSLH